MRNPDVTCPICRASIPLPVHETGLVTAEGLTVAVDTSYGIEHADMHNRCTCVWGLSGERTENPGCVVHA